MRTAYLLVSHGSSDPRHQAGLTRLAHGVQQHLSRLCRGEHSLLPTAPNSDAPVPSVSLSAAAFSESSAPLPFRHRSTQTIGDALPIVGTATLEAAQQSLAEQIVQFGKQVSVDHIQQIVVVPLFLLAGIHVKEDLPAEIAAAYPQLPDGLQITCLGYLGGQVPFKRYVAARLAKTKADRCVLLAHGSRRTAGNRAIQQLGKILDTDVAFWSVSPDLETQVYDLMQRGHQHIAIAPFFLFPGSITDAITHRTEQIAEQFPKLSLRLLSPLGTSSDLGKVVAELALAEPHSVAATSWSPTSPLAEDSITA